MGRRKPLPLSSIPVPTHRQASPPQHVPPAPRPRPVCAPSAPQASGGDTARRTRRSLPPAPRPQPVGGGRGGGSAQTGRRPAVFRTRHPAGATRGGGCLRHPDLQATPRKLRATGYALGLRLSVSSSHCLKSLPGERGGHTPAPHTPHPAPAPRTRTRTRGLRGRLSAERAGLFPPRRAPGALYGSSEAGLIKAL